ncbi:MAG: hypothetical protein R2795_21165 [Saprospiraceae bacterium]
MCVLMLSSCTQEANTPSTSETTLAATLQVENDPEFAELMTALKDETQSRRVLKQNCRCFIKVNSATNVGSASYNTWGLSDITYDENQPEFEIDGAEGAWLLQGVSYSLPSPYFELSTPSSGLHQLQLIQSNF